jgi:hypothetical protein
MAATTKDNGLSRGLFIAASVVQMLTAAAHTLASLQEPAPKNDQERQLIDTMRTVPVDLPGARRVMMDLFEGFGWHFTISLLALGVIGLIVARGDTRARQRFAGAAAVFMAALTVNSVIKFFLVPTAFMGVAAVLYAAAFLTGPKAESTGGSV